MQTAEQAAMDALTKMAREINNDLPADLHNYFVQICMSSDGVYATAIPLEDTYKDNDE